MEFLYGMIGALATIIFLCAAVAAGWLLRGKVEAEKKPDPPSVEEKERKRLIEEQDAFRDMMNYNSATAYQLNNDMDKEV